MPIEKNNIDFCFHAESVNRFARRDPEAGFRFDPFFSEKTVAAGLACACNGYPGSKVMAAIPVKHHVGGRRSFGLFLHETRENFGLSENGSLAGVKISDYPGAFFLDPSEPLALLSFLQKKGWLKRGETVQQTERAGEGNMNCVVRVRTNERSFILKQSRPWAEKYPQIAAPWNRARIEARFYREVKKSSGISAHIPELWEFDATERLLMLEDLGPAPDPKGFYADAQKWMSKAGLRILIRFLAILHASFRNPALAVVFSNKAMRRLNHQHIFSLPLLRDNGLNLDAITPGLARLAKELQANADYVAAITDLGKLYLTKMTQGACLLHGDYFPGSWMKVGNEFYVIDPEFCFYGPPEWDLGVMAAHFCLAGQQPAKLLNRISELYSAVAPLNEQLMRQFAGVEIMRRLIGVAQLPLCYGLDRKRKLLRTSLDLVLGGSAV